MKNNYLKNTLLAVAFVCCSMASFAQCVIPITNGQPYLEDFESGNGECWTMENGTNSSWAVLQGTESTVAAFSHQSQYSGDESRLISPVFDMSAVEGATLSFTYAMMGLTYADEFVISYRSSESDPWHDLGNFSFSDWQNFYEQSYELPDISSTYQISFLGRDLGGYYIFVDNVEIIGSGGCARPISLEVTDITSTTALLGWSTSGNEESWTIELNDENHTVSAQPYLMENLAPGRDYTFRVKANCGDGVESDWSMPLTFTTLCDVFVVTDDQPYFDDFESSEVFVCWQDEIVAGPYGWVVDPGYVILNNTAFFIWLGDEAMLVSRPLDISSVTNPTLTFKHKEPTEENRIDELSVWYASSENDYWHNLGYFSSGSIVLETAMFSLPDPSSTYYIAFKGKSYNGDGVYVDDVSVGAFDVVGVTEVSDAAFSLSPNPTTGIVTVVSDIPNGELVVFDLLGKKMATAKVAGGHAQIDLGDCANGMYLVRITGADKTKTIKVIKE